ncbi:MAG TPA: hypothetical protein VGL92_11455 [Acidimicrobiia bacterium]|jgi:hypothetical protein
MKAPEPKRRPAQRAVPLEGALPDTHLAPTLVALCHSGERAVTVFIRPGAAGLATFGSPVDPEAFVVWRVNGVYVFLRGEVPTRLELGLDGGAAVAVSASYE